MRVFQDQIAKSQARMQAAYPDCRVRVGGVLVAHHARLSERGLLCIQDGLKW